MNHSTLNLANALGAWLGGVVLDAGLGYEWPSRVGGLLAIGGLFAFLPPLLSPVRSLRRIPEAADEVARDVPAALAAGEDGAVAEGHLPRVAERP